MIMEVDHLVLAFEIMTVIGPTDSALHETENSALHETETDMSGMAIGCLNVIVFVLHIM